MSHLNWCRSSPLRKSHVDVHVSHATPRLPIPSGESLFFNLKGLLLYAPIILLVQI